MADPRGRPCAPDRDPRNGAPVRLRDIAHVIDLVEDDKVVAWFNGARIS